MKQVMLCALVVACVGGGAFFLTARKAETPVCSCETGPSRAPLPPASPPAPAVLPDVIELADIDPLLDPPARPVAGTPFDAEPPLPVNATPAPQTIPLLVD